MKFLGAYVKKTPFYSHAVSEEQKKVPITGENYMDLDGKHLLDFSRFGDVYLIFAEGNRCFVWNSFGKSAPPKPYRNENIDNQFEGIDFITTKERSFPRNLLRGFEFDGSSSTGVRFRNRNCFTLGHIMRNYEPLANLLLHCEEVNKNVTVEIGDGRLPTHADSVFEFVGILKGESKIPRALIRYCYRVAPNMEYDPTTGKHVQTGELPKRTVTTYGVWSPVNSNRKAVKLESYLHPYEMNLDGLTGKALERKEKEKSGREAELAENTKMVVISTENGSKGIKAYAYDTLANYLYFVPECFKVDYFDRIFIDSGKAPTDFKPAEKVSSLGGK